MHPEVLCGARLVWFAQVKYTIGGLSFSTLDMEHGILRGAAPSPAAIPVLLGQPQLAKPYFQETDPRKQLVRLFCGCSRVFVSPVVPIVPDQDTATSW